MTWVINVCKQLLQKEDYEISAYDYEIYLERAANYNQPDVRLLLCGPN